MLTLSEKQTIRTNLGRLPNPTEMHVFDACWSEHCSYKSSKHWLKQLYTKGEYVLHGPGENAGVVDIGDNEKIVFKCESHNHPSFIEPYQGAATGVGGIMRDIFTMGARPICNLNSLHFGMPHNSRHIIDGVVKGISDYGNCVGVPTVSSKCYFANTYTENPLVNAMSVGYTNKDIFTSVPHKKGVVVYVGAKTGRDGIGGAIMASEEFTEGEKKHPTVQVGDPFQEKLLIEASLELFETGTVIAAQDMGAAGILSSTSEVALKGNYGIEIDLAKVPLRAAGMEPWEILLSESQERMIFVLDEDKAEKQNVYKIFEKWDLDCFILGRLTDTNNFVVTVKDETVCDIPLKVLEAPELIRETLDRSEKRKQYFYPPQIVTDFDVREVWEQYDSQVLGNTIKSFEDVAIVRLPNSPKAIAIITAANPYYCNYNPQLGVKSVIRHCHAKLNAIGSIPLAITNCLNFGNPENPEIMWEFTETIEGMKEVCEELKFPVVSGNVSFYNETDGVSIFPTPVIGAVGLIENYKT